MWKTIWYIVITPFASLLLSCLAVGSLSVSKNVFSIKKKRYEDYSTNQNISISSFRGQFSGPSKNKQMRDYRRFFEVQNLENGVMDNRGRWSTKFDFSSTNQSKANLQWRREIPSLPAGIVVQACQCMDLSLSARKGALDLFVSWVRQGIHSPRNQQHQ